MKEDEIGGTFSINKKCKWTNEGKVYLEIGLKWEYNIKIDPKLILCARKYQIHRASVADSC